MFYRSSLLIAVSFFLSACAHTIAISPISTPARIDANLIQKKVAYVMTDVDRSKQITTAGGGGDKVTYLPYRDLEKVIRDALRSVYSDVLVIKSNTDSEAIKSNDDPGAKVGRSAANEG